MATVVLASHAKLRAYVGHAAEFVRAAVILRSAGGVKLAGRCRHGRLAGTEVVRRAGAHAVHACLIGCKVHRLSGETLKLLVYKRIWSSPFGKPQSVAGALCHRAGR